MKKNRQNQFLFLLIAGLIAIQSCKKNDPENEPGPENQPVKTGTLMAHLHTYIADTEVDDYGIVYTNLEGRKISLDLAQLYLSDFSLEKADGSVYSLPDSVVILQTQEQETYILAKVPVGNYKTVRFKFGLPADQNATIYNRNNIAFGDTAMWFGNAGENKGYAFLNLKGKIDTSAFANGTSQSMTPFQFKIGTEKLGSDITMPEKPFSVMPDQTEYVHILIDYDKVFSGIDLRNFGNLNLTTLSDSDTPLASKVATNILNAFQYEE
jgi:hypothetical protein